MPDHSVSTAPLFPRLLSFPFAAIPGRVHSTAIVAVLNRIFTNAMDEGELDFLRGRAVHIHVQDMRLVFCISLSGDKLVATQTEVMPDLSITGTLHSFMLLAARREDSDTLFFQRRLHMEGDTELGLEVKNFLDGMDMDSDWLSRQLEAAVQRALPVYERMLK